MRQLEMQEQKTRPKILSNGNTVANMNLFTNENNQVKSQLAI